MIKLSFGSDLIIFKNKNKHFGFFFNNIKQHYVDLSIIDNTSNDLSIIIV